VTDIPTAKVISLGLQRRFRVVDCQGERPFIVVRTKASDVVEAIRRAADDEMRECEKLIKDAAALHTKHCSHASTAHYLRCLANRIETDGGDAA
jgi:hypothetical protein